MIPKIILIFCILFVVQVNVFAQKNNQEIAYLKQKVEQSLDDNQIKQGIEFANKGIVLSKEKKDTLSLVTFVYLQSRLYRKIHSIDNALKVLTIGNVFATTPKYKEIINNQIGEILLEIGSYNLSIPYLINMVENEENPTAKFYNYNLLGNAYLKAGKSKECIHNFIEQLRLANQLKKEDLIINAYNNLGFVYFKFKDYQKSSDYLQKVITHIESQTKISKGNKTILINALITHSNISFLKKSYSDCVSEFEKALQLDKKQIDVVSVYKPYLLSLLKLGKRDKADNVIQEIKDKAANEEDSLALSDIFINYYLQTNQQKQLKKELVHFDALNHQFIINQQRKNQKYLELIGKFYLSSANNNLQIERNKSQRLALEKKNADYLLLISFISITIILAFVYSYIREKQKRSRFELKLIEKEKENLSMTLQLKQKDLSKASIDLIGRNQNMEDFLSEFKNISTLDAEEVKTRLVEKLKSIKQFNSSRTKLNQLINHRDIINTEFHEKLFKLHPDLTNSEIELCGYILLDMTSKDIANIKGIEPASVRISKTRLKKKLGLTNQNLSDYLRAL